MGDPQRSSIPYNDRSDPEKLLSNWTKTSGLFRRREYSVAVIRVGTCLEIAANILIREKLVKQSGLPLPFVDNLLHWANGLSGKLHKIILPLYKGTQHEQQLTDLVADIQAVNKQRNDVAHRGEFRGKQAAESAIRKAERAIRTMLLVSGCGVVLPLLEDALTRQSS